MPSEDSDLPTSVRRVETAGATRLIRLVESYEDMQTVLACCERLIEIFGTRRSAAGDDIGLEAVWTLALLSYARCFSGEGPSAALTADDLVDDSDGKTLHWHRVLLHLREQQTALGSNPREVYSVGVAQDETGAVNAVAVTSIRAPMVDEAAVRQAGALALPLCVVLDDRINKAQQEILDEIRALRADEVNALELIEVAATG